MPIQGTLVPGTFGQIPRNFFAGDFNYEYLKYKQATFGYEFEHRFDDVFTVRQNVRYLHNELNYVEVQPGRFTTTGAGPTLRLTNGRTISRSYFSTNENLNTFAADNQLQAKFNMGPLQHTVLAGLDYQRFDFNNFARFAGPPTRSISWRRTTPRISGSHGDIPEPGPATAAARSLCPGRGEARPAHRARRHPLRLGRGQHAGSEHSAPAS